MFKYFYLFREVLVVKETELIWFSSMLVYKRMEKEVAHVDKRKEIIVRVTTDLKPVLEVVTNMTRKNHAD